MKGIDKLLEARNLSDLAKLLGYKPSAVSFILYQIPDADKYKTFKVPKKAGGEREIKAPVSRLKLLQRRLADLLQQCFEELYGVDTPGRALSHGFRRNHSIITNANNHTKKKYVFNIDLEDFFPSINFGRVRGYFIKSRDFRLDPRTATVIAQIACHNNELPQGSPLSPVISNLIGNILDIRLVRLAKKARCTYSRYADDITFSTREEHFPKLIANEDPSSQWVPSKILEATIRRSGFGINGKKISMQYRTRRQMATGLVVNKTANIRAPYYRQARAMCNSLFRTGECHLGKEARYGEPEDGSTPVVGNMNQLRGILGHIYNVKKHSDEKRTQSAPTGIDLLFRRFLCFDKFHTLSKPLIICEGKTDNVYLECALKSLAGDFPRMIGARGAEIEWKIDFYKYSVRNVKIMRVSSGAGGLVSLMSQYENLMKPFLCPGQAFPVILVADNDGGAKDIKSKAKKLVERAVDGKEEFYRLVKNLYLVLLPRPCGEAEVEIEDYFDEDVLRRKVGGKSFMRGDEFDEEAGYGKHIFAEGVVRPGQGDIEFGKFRGLLMRIDKAIGNYAEVCQGR